MKSWRWLCLSLILWGLPADANCPAFSRRPTVQQPSLNDYRFKTESDGVAESFTLSNRTAVKILQQGCQSYELIFQFDTYGLQAPEDVVYWYQKSLILLEEVLRMSQPILNMRLGLQALRAYLGDRQQHPKKYGHPLPYGVREQVALVGVTLLEPRRYRLEVRFRYQPQPAL